MTAKRRQAELFKVLSVESRLKIVELLKRRGSLGVNDMAADLGITPSAVSQHLKVLRYAGLVRNERKGSWLPYEIDQAAMAEYKELIADVCNCGCPGTCRAQAATLASLEKREQELQEELREVRAWIRQAHEEKQQPR